MGISIVCRYAGSHLLVYTFCAGLDRLNLDSENSIQLSSMDVRDPST